MEVYESIGSFRGESSLATWMYRIAVNKSLQLLRKRDRKKRSGFFEALQNGNDEIEDIKDHTLFSHPGVALEQKEQATILMRAIDKLAERQRTAFTLHKMEQLSYEEIADIMETSISAVESLMHRAKKNLQEQLYSYYKKQNF